MTEPTTPAANDPHKTHVVDTATQSAVVDLGRKQRCGLGEAIYGEGKSETLILEIAEAMLDGGQDVLATRVTADAADALCRRYPHARHHTAAQTVRIPSDATVESERTAFHVDAARLASIPHVAVITAGSTDSAVADEAIETLVWARTPFHRYDDIGVAGPQRLLDRVRDIRHAEVVIVIAGMEGALPSVVAGHVSAPLIAVPTSVGYGANLAGITPLLSALASCAPGVMTVGIDAGFKAGYAAANILSRIHRPTPSTDRCTGETR